MELGGAKYDLISRKLFPKFRRLTVRIPPQFRTIFTGPDHIFFTTHTSGSKVPSLVGGPPVAHRRLADVLEELYRRLQLGARRVDQLRKLARL